MDLAALQTELQARGFDYLTTTRQNYFLNRAMHRFCEAQAWPFLEASATGASPLSIPDLRTVLSVVDSTSTGVLDFADYRDLRDEDPTMVQTGTPTSWYQSGSTGITAYPTYASTSLSVRYIKFPADMVNTSDTPPMPDRYRYALVDGAAAMAYRDSDNPDQAQVCQDAFDTAVLEAADSLLVANFDSARTMQVGLGSSTDW